MRVAGRSIEVQQTLIDRAVSYWNPQAGMRRLQARAVLSSVAGGYQGGRRDRRGIRNWRPSEGSADADTLPDLPDLRARSRDLARNAPIATGAIATVVTNVVGDGLQLQSCVDYETLGLSEEQADTWERAAEKEWRLFCGTSDFTRVQPFTELQALIFRSVLESGDVFIVRRYRKDAGDTYGTKLQVLEADRCSNPSRAADSDKVAGGVEIDGDGAPIAYHITDKHPGNLRAGLLKWERVAARTAAGKQVILHLFDRMRPELTRGVPYLAPVIEHLKALSDYSDAEVRAAVVSAMFTVFVETSADETDSPVAGERGSELADNEVKLGTGAIVSLAPGEKATMANPGRPNDKFDPFVQAFLRQIGVALELPFELLIKHFTASYSASRAALEMAWQAFRKRRNWFSRRFCQVVYEWMIEEAVATGRLPAPGYFDSPLVAQAYCGARWLGPGRPSVDQTKDAEADKAYLEMEVTTREEIRMERFGDRGDWEAVHKQAAKEARMRRADGTDAPAPASPPPGQGYDSDKPAEDDTADDETDTRRQA
jgi:lambda family phage portal protein